MPSTVMTAPLAHAALIADVALRAAAPDLVVAFRENLPRAADVVSRRLFSAVVREGLIDDSATLVADRHGFGRVEVASLGGMDGGDPAQLLRDLARWDHATAAVADELTDATVNLALAYARRASLGALPPPRHAAAGSIGGGRHSRGRGGDLLDLAAVSGADADEQCAFFERFATEGHNLHPCARTRLGWSVPDLLSYDLESPVVPLGFVGIRRDVHIGDDVGAGLLDRPGTPLDPARYAVTPVHAWQRERIRQGRHADLIRSGVLVPLEHQIDASPTAALRTVLLPDQYHGPRYVKVSLDIQVTSTRRTISIASTRNGPVLSRLLERLMDDLPAAQRVLLMAEPWGSAARIGAGRDFSAIIRTGLAGRLAPAEVAVPGSALYATSPVTGVPIVAELVDRFASTRGSSDRSAAALGFVEEYARLLLPPVLSLATRHGIGLEAHLQNCVPTFVDGVPHRLGLRDLAGMRLYPPRLDDAPVLWPESVIVTDDLDVMRAKVAYTALQAHLGEVVVRLVHSHNLDEPRAWRAVRQVMDEVFDGLSSDPRVAPSAAADHAFLTAPTVPHKALLGMRLASGRGEAGDLYVPVDNPLR